MKRLAWFSCLLSLALAAASVVFIVLNRLGLEELAASGAYLNDLFVAVTFPVVGALIAARRPDHVIGWIFCAVGVFVAAVLLA
jgi:hypothetical protein